MPINIRKQKNFDSIIKRTITVKIILQKLELPKNNNNNKIAENLKLPPSNNNSTSSNYHILSSANTSYKSICVDEFISAINTVLLTNYQIVADVQEDGNQQDNENNTRKNDSQTSTSGSIFSEIQNVHVIGGNQDTDIINNSVDARPQGKNPSATEKTKSNTKKISIILFLTAQNRIFPPVLRPPYQSSKWIRFWDCG